MIRSTLKRGIKKVLGLESQSPPPPPPSPTWTSSDVRAAPASAPPSVTAEPAHAAPPPPPAAPPAAAVPPPEVSAVPAAPVPAAPAPAAAAATPAAESPKAPVLATDDTAGAAFTFEQVQEIMDEMVRPALQGDGGDITLLRVENNDVYVKLVGSCSTCPSSIMTMKMGVEALLKEEFPAMGALIQVEA